MYRIVVFGWPAPLLTTLFLLLFAATDIQAEKTGGAAEPPSITFHGDIDRSVYLEVSRAGEALRQQTASLFDRQPLEWDWKTIEYLPDWLMVQATRMTEFLSTQSLLAGMILLGLFLIAGLIIIYQLAFRKRFQERASYWLQGVSASLPAYLEPVAGFILKLLITICLPLLLFGLHHLLLALTRSEDPWFLLAGRLLWLWLMGVTALETLKTIFVTSSFGQSHTYSSSIFKLSRIAALTLLVGISIFWSAEAFQIRADILALVHFVISVTLAVAIFLLLLPKTPILSLLPERPYRSYRLFVNFITRFYFPLLFFSFAVALLWCIGYRNLGSAVLFRLWGTALAIVCITVTYHYLMEQLKIWGCQIGPEDEAAAFLIRSLKGLLTYSTLLLIIIVGLNLLGLLEPLQRIMSFPVVSVADRTITFWTFLKAALVLLAFVFASRLFQAYLDYKIYPALGIEPGLGYALNTFLQYLLLGAGFLIALQVVGLDLRFLYVFAGAIGIGIGIGMQNMAANVISGFSVIFGGKIRKGDWIQVGNTMGLVTDIYLGSTSIRTRDNIEYLIPNAKLISDTIVNYTLSSPLIRMDLDVGASYNARPKQVEEILLAAAEAEPMVSKAEAPVVRFIRFGDSSIDFQLLFWIDVKKVSRRKVKSALYFSIFDRFAAAGIEIPFPQRDVHIKG